MADVPAIAPAAAPVAPAAPPADAPAATPATPPAGATPTAPAMQRRLGQVEKKSYGTRPAQHSVPSAAAPATVPASATAEGSATSAPSAEATKTDPAAQPVETAPAEKVEPKVTDAEEARRLARINRAESKLATERRAFAEERARHDQALQRMKVIEQAATAAKTNPLAFLRQFGVEPQAILDSIVADGAKPEATRSQEARAQEASELQRKIAQLEKSVQTAAEAQKQEAHARDVAAYKSSAIAPVLSDASKYELTNRVLGQSAVEEVFALQEKRFQFTAREVQAGRRQAPEVLTPGQAADIIEKHLRSQRDALNGTSVAPAKPPTSTRIEPAPAQTSGSQTQNQANGRFRIPPKPYTTKLVR